MSIQRTSGREGVGGRERGGEHLTLKINIKYHIPILNTSSFQNNLQAYKMCIKKMLDYNIPTRFPHHSFTQDYEESLHYINSSDYLRRL